MTTFFPFYHTRPNNNDQLGEATLTLDREEWDASDMSFLDMIHRYNVEIDRAKKVTLSSSLIGDWFYNHDTEHWKRQGLEHRV